MKTISIKLVADVALTKTSLVAIGIFLAAGSALADVRYVNVNNANPTPPHTNWLTAATNIQDAVDAAVAGDEIVVTNGTYATCGRTAGTNIVVNRVTLDKPVAMRSVNGPQFTIIQGRQIPGDTNGIGAVRCAYLTNGASLSGFTLTQGATRNTGDRVRDMRGAGAFCEASDSVISNSVLIGNVASTFGGGAYQGTLYNCTVTGNVAYDTGGGACAGTLNDCTLTGNVAGYGGADGWDTLNQCTLINNSAWVGGGSAWSTLNNCKLSGNSAGYYGGGAADCTLNNCTLTGNSAGYYGGGACSDGNYPCILSNCTLTGNSAYYYGGGAERCTLNNCTLIGNSIEECGGGADWSTLNNCTLTGNSATGSYDYPGHGGGASDCTLTNCTLTGNSAYDGGGAASDGDLPSMLSNCTLSGNSATNGGGAIYSVLNNCILSGNSVTNAGGGTYGSTLNNCTLSGNSAGTDGGGACYGALSNCTLSGNSAGIGGGGAYQVTLNNCIVYFNTATNAANYFPTNGGNLLTYCCTALMPTSGVGNITNAPLFVDYAGGNLHLQSNSPCINAGTNAYVVGSTDLDGNPRIVGGTVDIGAYECQSPALLDYFTWLQSYSLSTYAGALYADSDGDGMNNWQEYLADTSPLDANDYLHITSFTRSGTYNTLWWTSKSTRLYQVDRNASLDAASPWETIITNTVPGWNNVGFDNTGPQYFYRIRAVQP